MFVAENSIVAEWENTAAAARAVNSAAVVMALKNDERPSANGRSIDANMIMNGDGQVMMTVNFDRSAVARSDCW